jgi:hypothetical protein
MHILRHDELTPAETARSGTARSGKMVEGDMAPARVRPLQYTLLLVSALCILAAVGVLASRSIWIDEAMLLRSVYEIGVLDFLHPLPYYDQASPFIPSVVIKLISSIAGTNFILFRWLIFVFIALCAAPFLIKITRAYGMNTLLAFILIYAASVYNVLFHMTEIKHYGFEIAAVFIFLYWLLIYMENPEQSLQLRRIWIPLLAISMSFSTLLLFPAVFLFVIIDSVSRPTTELSPGEVTRKHAIIFILMLTTTIAMYAHMKHLTIFQMNNTWSERTYGSQGLINDTIVFTHIVKEAYGGNFLIVFSVMSLVALVMPKNVVAFRLNIFFLCIIIIIFILKLADVYPVVATRHIVWMIPINIAITAFLVHDLLLLSKKLSYLLSIFLLLNVGTIIIKEQIKIGRGFTAEYQDNNALYRILEDLESSDVFVYGHARPSLEIYRMRSSGLSKHRYFGLMPDGDLSSIGMPLEAAFTAGPLGEQEFTDWQFAQLPQTRTFILLISHSEPIDPPSSEPIRALRNTLGKNACAYQSLFTAHAVQLLQVSCAQPGTDEEPARGADG